MSQNVTFTLTGMALGARRSLPLAASVFAYGLVFGALARQAGLSPEESLLMSGLVFAGSAQFVVLELWTPPLPVATIVLTALVINARHLLMGAALRPWFARLPAPKIYGSAFFLNDESWALTVREFTAGGRDAAFLLGSGLTLFAAWFGATATGQALGAAVGDPKRWGLDVALTAVFAALLVGLWEGRRVLFPWAVAATAAVLADRWLPGAWYVLLGGVAGSVAGAIRDDG